MVPARYLMPENWRSVIFQQQLDADANSRAAVEPPPDYACGGVEVEDRYLPHTAIEALGWEITETNHRIAYGITYERAPDLMASIRDIARGS